MAEDQPDQPERVFTIPNLISLARLAGVPVFLWLVLGVRTPGRRLVGGRPAAWRPASRTGWTARSRGPEPAEPPGRGARPGRRPALHRRRRSSRWPSGRSSAGGWSRSWPPVSCARRRAARPAAPRIRTASRQLRWQGGHTEPSVRVSAAFSWFTRDVICRSSPGVRLGVRTMGNCTLLVGCCTLRRAGSPPARRRPGRPSGGATARHREGDCRDGRAVPGRRFVAEGSAGKR